ncbi:MAG: ParB/RepB/Spo0J family partition protein [Planctomycetota bacterium]|nr:MAG: ParB/RepB/Spo0J family partition protein [Planctomycetota bacterium]
MSEQKSSRGLGRGLRALIGQSDKQPVMTDVGSAEEPLGQILSLPVDSIDPNPLQPRSAFSDSDIDNLARTISTHGVLSPILVRKTGKRYELINGERRLRAAKSISLGNIPAIIREEPDHNILELALIENVQREDLNPMDLARAYRNMCDTLKLTAGEVAHKVGKKRETVANYVRLLQLDEDTRKKVAEGKIKFGHARALLAIEDPVRRKRVVELIVKQGISVRQVEKFAGTTGPIKSVAFFAEKKQKPPYIEDLEQKFRERLGTKVVIRENKGKGKITIDFYTNEDFERIMGILGVSNSDF